MNGNGEVYRMPIGQLEYWLLEHNYLQSQQFRSPDAKGLRIQYRARYPTKLIALKCMDGRLNLSVMTKTPLGIFDPYRNLGGYFDLGWPLLGEVLVESVNHSLSNGHDCIFLVTYHYSKGAAHRGCRGFNYDISAARAHTTKLVDQIGCMFGSKHSVVYPVQVGIETDEDTLIFHGVQGEVLDVSELMDSSTDVVRHRLETIFPDMKQQMIHDLLPLVVGNAQHVAEVRKEGRPILDAEHRERILGIGRGFDWLHILNLALLVGPFDPNLDRSIAIAASLLKMNIDTSRVPNDGLILLSSAPYRHEAGFDQPRAVEKARFLTRFALEAIRESIPELRELVRPITATINVNTRELQIV